MNVIFWGFFAKRKKTIEEDVGETKQCTLDVLNADRGWLPLGMLLVLD
jgi:hypothetical protein